MKKSYLWVGILLFALVFSASMPLSVRADVAPPEQPPGASIMPGGESTQVRMLAETVTLTVLSKPAANFLAQAKTEADFTMRNLGTAEEKMEARFPLTFWDEGGDGFFNFPEIPDIQIFVNGKSVPTHRIDATYTSPGGIALSRSPWAAFDVTFPPGKDVQITVKYTTNGYGYAPFVALRYILETGAGWNGTIGTADIVIKLPYDATAENVLLDESSGFSETTLGAQLVGQEVRWHFEDFEPAHENNIALSLVIPSYWQKILDWRTQTAKTPDDGEAWGQLGKALKEAIRYNKGYLRESATGNAMYTQAVQAYQKSVTLLPKDALWHYGFADLLWSHYYFNSSGSQDDYSAISQAVDELRQSLALDSKNQNAQDLATWISGDAPWALSKSESGYDYLILTATPEYVPPDDTPLPALPTSTLEPTQAVAASATPVAAAPTAERAAPGTPLCGNVAVLLIPLLGLLFWRRRK